MRFAITGIDRSLSVLDAFLKAGWDPVKLFTVPVDNYHDYHANIVNQANQLKIPVQMSRIVDADLKQLGEIGCDILVVASYNWRVGDWSRYIPYAVNFHPSLLPQARGPYPMIQAILQDEPHWGVTCHKLSPQFDEGDVLAQMAFPLTAEETHESINLKIEMTNSRLAGHVAKNFQALWDDAWPQEGGSYWPMPGEAERTIDFRESVASILRQVRAYGLFECKTQVNGTTVYVRRAVGWVESHAYQPGALVYTQQRMMVIAASDGLIGLIEWSAIKPGEQRHVGR